jgi:hypothetical protein
MDVSERDPQGDGDEKTGKINILPLTLTIKDAVWILTAVVSIVVAWGLYGSRITVLESNQLITNDNVKELKVQLEKQKDENIKQNQAILELQIKNHIPPRSR